MGAEVNVGTFAAVVSPTNSQSITGVGFHPKAMMFYWTDENVSGSFGSNDQGFLGIGFTDGTNHYSAFGNILEWGNASRGMGGSFYDACIATSHNDGFSEGLTSKATVTFDSDGFSVHWSTPRTTGNGGAFRIGYLCFGGASITNAQVGTFDLTNSSGSQSVTGIGFRSDSLFMLTSEPDGGTTSGMDVDISAIFFGFDSRQNGPLTTGLVSDLGAESAARLDKALFTYFESGTSRMRVTVTSHDADGWTFDKEDPPTGNTRVGYLALKGLECTPGRVLWDGTDGNVSVTGIKQPIGVIQLGPATGATDVQSGTQNAEPSFGFSFGAWDGTNQAYAYHGGNDNIPTKSADRQDDLLGGLYQYNPESVWLDISGVSLDASGFTVDHQNSSFPGGGGATRLWMYIALGPPIVTSQGQIIRYR